MVCGTIAQFQPRCSAPPMLKKIPPTQSQNTIACGISISVMVIGAHLPSKQVSSDSSICQTFLCSSYAPIGVTRQPHDRSHGQLLRASCYPNLHSMILLTTFHRQSTSASTWLPPRKKSTTPTPVPEDIQASSSSTVARSPRKTKTPTLNPSHPPIRLSFLSRRNVHYGSS